jgi:signal recognition particle receptor subunit beta
MPQLNLQAREITLKIVYYGPALSGKTTNLAQMHALCAPTSRGDMVTLNTQEDRTLYFDFLPIRFGLDSEYNMKLKLFTVPGQVLHRATRRVVLAGADGIAFIADSRRSCASSNAYSYRDLEANLRANGIAISAVPLVVQFNKRDMEDIKPLQEIREAWQEAGVPTVPAVARRGEGVVETFEVLMQRLYLDLEERHSISVKLQVSQSQFMRGVMQHFRRAEAAGAASAP